jgi:hypothetical protein
MNTERRALAQVFLMLPAILFLGSVVVRNVQPLQPAAERVVMWYAARMWTLWVLLLALPLMVLVTGCVTLFVSRNTQAVASGQVLAAVRGNRALALVATLTLVAGVVLAIVLLHMGAN